MGALRVHHPEHTWWGVTAISFRSRTALIRIVPPQSLLIPQLGRMPLTRLQPQHVQALLHQLLSAGKAPKTARNCFLVLHRALEQAVRWRLVNVNVADLVDTPRVQPREMQALTAEEARQVLAAAKGDPFEALWWLALTAGLRQGELLALRWADVDLERRCLRVVASLIRIVGQEPQLGEPKSRRSRRQVELLAGALEALRRHRLASPSIGFVFARADGSTALCDNNLKALAAAVGRGRRPRDPFPRRAPHGRHVATRTRRYPKVVSELLGHSTVAITLDVYSHVTPAMHREATKVMDDILG